MGTPLRVAVFPLPKIVAFPGHSLQFHIFEPRYRKMVRDCQEQGLWLGVAQGELVKKARGGQTLEEFLSSNQETYTPLPVFGVGPMRVLKELPDGRYVIEVEIVSRVRMNERLQELPYTVVEAEPLEDATVPSQEEARLVSELKAEIARIAALRTGLLKHLQSKEYFDDSNLSSLVYSILKWFVIENREGQSILEDDSPTGRAEKLLAWMRYFVREASVHVVRQEARPTRARKDRKETERHDEPRDAGGGDEGREAPVLSTEGRRGRARKAQGEEAQGRHGSRVREDRGLGERTSHEGEDFAMGSGVPGAQVIPVDFRHKNVRPEA